MQKKSREDNSVSSCVPKLNSHDIRKSCLAVQGLEKWLSKEISYFDTLQVSVILSQDMQKQIV